MHRKHKAHCAKRHQAQVKQGAVVLAVCAVLAVLPSQQAEAVNMYVYKDKSGNALLTNKKDPKGRFSKYTKKVKVTWYKDTNVHAYKNWGKNEYAVLPKYTKNRSRFDQLIANSASRHGIDPALMKAIMHTESGFNPRARSPVGAQGLMQLMPATARQYGVRNPWSPAQNIEGSAKYLKYLKKLFKGNTKLVLAGYNAGQGNVLKYGGIPPFKETRNYVKRVMSRYHNLYKNKSFIITGSSQRITSTQLAKEAANPISRYRKNNVNYIKTSASSQKYHKGKNNAGYTKASYTKSNANGSSRKQHTSQRASTQDPSYTNSAFDALKKGRYN